MKQKISKYMLLVLCCAVLIFLVSWAADHYPTQQFFILMFSAEILPPAIILGVTIVLHALHKAHVQNTLHRR
ncbi:MAG: hypothetical protein H6634_10630 [Anaerolineales bacterium]|nr:hypothetical protein [Anaerolineales bacterium]MCB9111692.1 hypothetical protein [Anaerolineales bacterium]